MNKHNTIPILFGFIISLFALETKACGYAWISDCSSQVQMRINGTLDSFDIAACPSGFNFDGIQLGNLQSLSLANAKAITWESCQNNVSAVFLKYRVYEQGQTGGSWQSLSLQQYHQAIDGPYTTRYTNAPVNISLTSGLTIGKTYTLEIYLLAEVDTIGDDFIPETTLLRNNAGANYKMSFTYGGPAAPPISLLPHLTQPACNGQNNGNIYVSAYGNVTGLFYNWSNVSLNFFQQFNLVAGSYSITVTNAQGQTASATMQLGQPEWLQTTFINVQSFGCNNTQGAATVLASGGTAPYHYLWQTGQQTDSIVIPVMGEYFVTTTDAHGCTATNGVVIGSTGVVERNISSKICDGATYSLGGQQFTTTGDYNIWLQGTAGCDTLIHLALQVNTPEELFTTLPDNVTLSCSSPAINLCAGKTSEATYEWLGNGVPAGNTPCLLVTGAGTYLLNVSVNGCKASKTIQVEEYLSIFPTFSVSNASSSTANDGTASVSIMGGQPPFTVAWSNGANTFDITNLAAGTYCVTVEDNNGCITNGCATVSFESGTISPDSQPLFIFPNPVVAGQMLELTVPEDLAGETILVKLMDEYGRVIIPETIRSANSGAIQVIIPLELNQNMIFLRLSGTRVKYSSKIFVLKY